VLAARAVTLPLYVSFLGAFTKFAKSDCSLIRVPSVRPHGTTRLPPDGFS